MKIDGIHVAHSTTTRTTDNVFYSSDGDTVYKNTAAGMRESLGLNNVNNTGATVAATADKIVLRDSGGDIFAAGVSIDGNSDTLFSYSDGTRSVYGGCDSNDPWFGTSSNHDLRLVTYGGERMRIDNTGNVGIGVTSPGYKLHVNGSIYGSGVTTPYLTGHGYIAERSYTFNPTSNTTKYFLGWTDQDSMQISIRDSGWGHGGTLYATVYFQWGNTPSIVIHKQSGDYTFYYTYKNDRMYLWFNNSGNSNNNNIIHSIRMRTTVGAISTTEPGSTETYASTTIGSSAATEFTTIRLCSTKDGNVGIGTASPSYTLDVGGDINIASGSNLRIGGSIPVFSRWTSSGSDIYRQSGSVGIGTASPVGKLDVWDGASNGTNVQQNAFFYLRNPANAATNYGAAIVFENTDGAAGTRKGLGRIAALRENNAANYSSYLQFSPTVAGTEFEAMRITSAGNVGIGTASPQTKLNVRGSVSTGRNLAREVGTVISYSSQITTSRGAANVITGSKNLENGVNDWITANGQRANAYLVIDLGTAYAVDRLVIYNQNEYSNSMREVKGFKLQGSADNSTWTDVITSECGRSNAHEANPGWSFRIPQNWDDDTEGSSYRYWKFIMTSFHGTDGYGGIMELELYEASDALDDEVSTSSLVAEDVYGETGNFSRGVAIGKGYGGTSTGANRLLVEGNVGIGNTNPAFPLTIGSSDGNKIQFNESSTPGHNITCSSGWQFNFNAGRASTDDDAKITFNISGSSGYDEMMRVTHTGVGIGTTSPHCPLQVNGTGGSMSVQYKQFFRYDVNISGNYGWTANPVTSFSIYANGAICSGDYLISHNGTLGSSDERIKKNIVDADDAECLETLRLLKPKKYQYKDEIERGQEPVWGFIAQEVRETLPYATQLRQDVLPNIYELANVSSSNVITFTDFNTSNLESNATTLIRTKGIDGKDHDIHLVEVVDEHTIRVEEDLSLWTGSVDAEGNVITQIETTTLTPEEYEALEDKTGCVANISGYQNANVVISVEEYNGVEDTTGYEEVIENYTKTVTTYPGTQLFIYGQEVDDFVFLKKDAIWTVATSALQEVDRQQQADKVRIAELESRVEELEAMVSIIKLNMTWPDA